MIVLALRMVDTKSFGHVHMTHPFTLYLHIDILISHHLLDASTTSSW